LLLTEMQHRVKNDFRIILSMIEMQKRRLSDRKAVRSLDHITNRINAISLAHDQLSPEHGLRAVNVAVYLQALCAPIEHQLEGITINVEADDVDLLIDRTVPLGLGQRRALAGRYEQLPFDCALDAERSSVALWLKRGLQPRAGGRSKATNPGTSAAHVLFVT